MKAAASSWAASALVQMSIFDGEEVLPIVGGKPKAKGQAARRPGKRPMSEVLLLDAGVFPNQCQWTELDGGSRTAPVLDSSADVADAMSIPTNELSVSASFALAPTELRKKVVTLGDALRVLPQLDDVPANTRGEWRSAMTSFARGLAASLDDIKLAPEAMRPHLASTLHFLKKGTGSKRQSNIRSALNAIAIRTGWVTGYGGAKAHTLRDTAWRELLAKLSYAPQKSIFAGFARYCESEGVAPDSVGAETLRDYEAWRLANTYDTHVAVTISAVRCLWNRSSKSIPGWPASRLESPVSKRRYRRPMDEFRPSFVAAIAAYTHDVQHPDPLEDHARRPVSPTTAHFYGDALLWAASALTERGHRLDDFGDLSDLVTPANLKKALEVRHARSGSKWCSMARTIAQAFRDVARRTVGLCDADLAVIDRHRSRVKSPSAKLSEQRTDDTLAITENPKVLQAFMRLPSDISDAAQRLLKAGRPVRAAQMHEVAVAIALLLQSPLRRRALVQLDYKEHFHRTAKGRAVAFRVPPALSKTGVRVDHTLDRPTSDLVMRHLKEFRPHLLVDQGDTALFPSCTPGVRRHVGGFAARVKRTVEKLLGTRFYLHLVRHVVADLLLSDDPNNAPIAQRMLGHSNIETTEKIYGHLRTRGADKHYAAIIDRKMQSARHRKAKTAP